MAGNGYTGSYAGGGIGPGDVPYDTKVGGGIGMDMHARSNASIGPTGGASIGAATRSIGQTGSITGAQSAGNPDTIGASSPLMGSGNAGVGAGGGLSSPEHISAADSIPAPDTQTYQAKALYACKYRTCAKQLFFLLLQGV